MKRLLSSSLLFVMFFSAAYAEKVSNKTGRNTGTFEIATPANATVQASYSIFGAAPDNIVVIINPSQEFVLNAHIVNSEGLEQIALKSETVSLRYVNNIDVSKLNRGDYFFELMYSDGTTYRIPFSKE